MWVRLSCTDWTPGGHTIADNIEIAKMLKATGKVDDAPRLGHRRLVSDAAAPHGLSLLLDGATANQVA
jgi:2,4-dienoyl-CoA reductase-like NADH-dependent reductase (Old Yellow Enzyme family)